MECPFACIGLVQTPGVALPESRQRFRDRTFQAKQGTNEGGGMKRADPGSSLRSLLFLALLAALPVVHGPQSAAAEDPILPLKVKVGEKAPDFAVPSANGKTMKLSDYAGHSVLIDFYRGYW
jgi:hypothetical protein